MWLTRAFIQRPPLVFVLIAIFFIAGLLGVRQLAVQDMPNTSPPGIGINVSYPGASTTIMRDSIVEPIENAIAGSPNLQTVSSVIENGQASVSATFTLESNQSTDLTNVEKGLQSVTGQLPADLLAPTVAAGTPGEPVVVSLSVKSTKLSLKALSLLVKYKIGPVLQQIPGVSGVHEGGLLTPAFEVRVRPGVLAATGLTLGDIITTIGQNNVRAPAGTAYASNRETNINVQGGLVSSQSIAGLAIAGQGTTLPSSLAASSVGSGSGAAGIATGIGALSAWSTVPEAIRIGDVADVSNSAETQTVYAYINGGAGISLDVTKNVSASEVTVSDAVIAALPALQKQFSDVVFSVDHVQSTYSKQQVMGVLHTLIEAIVITGIVMLFFLRSWRSAIVVLVAIPTSLCVALFMMWRLNLTLDTISLLAMTLVIGILIDDSTVVLENIERHFQAGEEPAEAAVNGRSEIGTASIVLTLVDVVVFLPIAFMSGPIGQTLREFGIVVVTSTLTSLFVAFTLTPTLAGLWALQSTWKPWKPIEWFTAGFERLRVWYAERALPWSLAHPWPLVLAAVALFVGAAALVPTGLVGETYVPAGDQGEIFLQFTYPTGTPVTTVRGHVLAVEQYVDRISDLETEQTQAGQFDAPFGGPVQESNVGQIHLFLKAKRAHSTQYWIDYLHRVTDRVTPHANILLKPASAQSGGPKQPIDELVSLTNGGDPSKYAQRVYQALKSTPGAVSVNDSAAQRAPQVDVVFNRGTARALDVGIGTAATAVRSAFGGAVASQTETSNGLMQIRVVYALADRHDLGTILAIPIRADNGTIVHVGDIAAIRWAPAPQLITRTNGADVVHVDANIAASAQLSNVTRAFEARVAALHLPPSVAVHVAPQGQQDQMRSVLGEVGSSLILSFALVFLIMVALYNSYRTPLVVMFAIPLAVIGALGALWITHETLNLFSLIGAILLVGIVAKNGILLVDYADILRARGRSKLEAIKESGATRFRAILMTTVAMIFGMAPLALALEPGASQRSSLGIVVIGGLTSSLILTLAIVPIMYMWIAPKELRKPREIPASSGGAPRKERPAIAPARAQEASP
ncbi:MAG: efflux RND transporter permease subunit [Candidatus Eremiobacteraeota bacterium]|nr:efflux RND transporter permease subunit [Candidatus Eremiobacteraeota bacterium]